MSANLFSVSYLFCSLYLVESYNNNNRIKGDHMKIILAYDRPDSVRELFLEYTNLLIEGDPNFIVYLELQNYDDEISNLEKKYGLPKGRLYLAYDNENLVGCIGLREIYENNCEMKRLYVRDNFRGLGIGKMLVSKLIQDAVDIGYSHMLLDTLPFLENAIKMYKDFGFYEIEPYNDSPMGNSIYMRLDL